MHLPGARPLAMLAFSLYLTHLEVAHLVHAWLPQATAVPRWRTVPVYAVSCLAAAAVLYYGVERPFLRLREHRDKQRVEPDVEARMEPAL
jgi:peptidoglycan/LPS O-acetylase OafA/YrhL